MVFFAFFRKPPAFQQTVPGFPETNAFVRGMDSPSISQQNFCSVNIFSSASFCDHWNHFSVRRLYSRIYPMPSPYNPLM